MQPSARRLKDLSGIGKAMLRDLELLGVGSVDALARRNPQRLYDDLSRLTGQRQDPCVLDTFRCAVAQAKDPNLPDEKRLWWHWSKLRKQGK